MVSQAKQTDFTFLPLSKEKTDSTKLSVLSYNILASMYCNQTHFASADSESLNSKARLEKIVAEFKELKADIICLQEAEEVYKKELEDLGYEAYFSKRKTRNFGCIIALRKERALKLLESDTLDMDLDHIYSKNPDFLRDNLAIYLKIEDQKNANKLMHVVNTHFYYDPNFDYVKYFQMFLVLKMFNSKAKEDEALVFCGDLNSLPGSNPVNLILKQELPSQDRCDREFSPEIFSIYTTVYEDYLALKSAFSWAAVYENYKRAAEGNEKGGFPAYTNYTESFKATIDYIFYTPTRLQPISILKIPSPEAISDKTLPNLKYPSDHLPIMAVFEYND